MKTPKLTLSIVALIAIVTVAQAQTFYWESDLDRFNSGVIEPSGIQFYGVRYMAVDSAGYLYVTGEGGIIQYTSTYVSSQFASVGNSLAFDDTGNLYAGDGNGVVYKITTNKVVSTIATLSAGVIGVGCDHSGNVYATTPSFIDKITPDGTVSLYANLSQFGIVNWSGNPVLDSQGNLFVRGGYNPSNEPPGAGAQRPIFKMTPDGTITEFAYPNVGGDSDANDTLAIDASDNIYAVDCSRNFSFLTQILPNGSQASLGTLGLLEVQAFAYTPLPALTPLPTPPSITNQPQPALVNAYAPVSFSVMVSGTPPLSYQWTFNGTNLPSGTNSTLTISNATQGDLGAYRVLVTNNYGSATSSVVTLSMYPFLAAPFTGAVTYWGKSNTLSVCAWGTGPLSYQWLFNGVPINNATNQTFILNSIQFTNAGLYSVVVMSPLGSVTNTPEQVVVSPAGVSLGLSPTVVIDGVIGYNYAIQRTADLSDTNSWLTMTNLTLTAPVQLWVDTNLDASRPTNPQQYYRVLPGQ